MTSTRYRRGAYVIDTRTYRMGVVMDHVGDFTQVRPPHGGREWDCPPEVLRAAMTQERRAAGITAADEYRTAWASDPRQAMPGAAVRPEPRRRPGGGGGWGKGPYGRLRAMTTR